MEYRINGFEQIKAFYSWVFNNPDKIRPTHISLYLFLLNQNNRSNWVEWFKCPYDLAMQGACIGNNGTYYKCLDELKLWNLIDYQKGTNNFKAPLVKLFVLYKNEHLPEQVTVPLPEHVSEQQYVQLTEQQCEQLPVHIYKLITNNIEPISNNFEKFEKFVLSLSKNKTKFTPPTLDEVKNYFKENGYNEQTSIKMFNSYSIADCKDSKGKQVLNWKQKAINVWFKDENKIKQQPAKKISYYDEFNGTN